MWWPVVVLLLVPGGVLCNKPPTFLKNLDLAVIRENTPVGSEFFRLQGSDPENSSLTYGVEGTDRFRVDAHTGLIRVAAPLDREADDTLRFFVTLEDVVGPGEDNNLVRVPVTVIVLDENDNEPQFVGLPYDITVAEDAPVGRTLFEGVEARDADEVGGVLQIRCDAEGPGGEACERFSVLTRAEGPGASVAALVLRRSLDFAEAREHALPLVADDGRHRVNATLRVTVRDVQNRPPVFVGSLSAVIDEDAPLGTLLATVRAEDGDRGRPRSVHYELVTNPEEFFVVHPTSGEVRTARPLDRERFAASNGVLSVGLKATEVLGNGALAVGPDASAVAALSVTIRDVNDEPPTFDKVSYTVSVNENVPDGTPLPNLDLFVRDTDTGSNAVFNVELVDASGIFSVEPPLATGATSVSIRVARGPLDYENPNQRRFILLVVAKEAFARPALSGTGTVTVNVLDVNDNAPRFERAEYRAGVAESAPAGTVVHTITATDRDSKAFGEAGIVYSIFGNGAERFQVEASSGVITVAACETPGSGNCLDFETRPVYYLSYQAADEGGAGQAAVVPLVVTLADANDNPPVFLRDRYEAAVEEGALALDAPLRVQAVDADASSAVHYSIVSGNALDVFSVDGRSGEISVARRDRLDVAALDTDRVTLKVQASDGGKGIATATVLITVKDANNNSPVFQRSVYTATVSESAPPGTPVEQVSATDADRGPNARLTYSLQRGGLDHFRVHPDTGLLEVSGKLDYDRRRGYDVEVVAADGGSPRRTGTATVRVLVLNSNDKAPHFAPATQRAQVTEDAAPGHAFYALRASDPDAGGPDSLRYALAEPITATDKDGRPLPPHLTGYKSFFAVSRERGEVSVASRLDRETAAVVTLTVVVTDVSAEPPQSATGTLVVTIVDLNDHPPSFAQPEVRVRIMEEQPVGSVVATLVATDPDSNIAEYRIEPDNPLFHIDRASGVVSVRSRIDYESVREMSFRVVAYDTGVPQRSATATVSAEILNVNDNDPVFGQSAYEARIPENSPQDTVVARVEATDADAGDHGALGYSLLGERSHEFTIDTQGVVRVAAAADLDRETTPSLTLQVVATDRGPDPEHRRAISVPLYVSLEDRNDNAPAFEQREYAASVVGETPPAAILQLTARDADEGDNARVLFTIVGGNEDGTFGLNEATGVLYPQGPLSSAQGYVLQVRASNPDGRPAHDEAVVRVRVVDINQHKPRFRVPAVPNATVHLPESSAGADLLVLTVSAEDEDKGENGRVSYFLKAGDANVLETEHFRINSVTGEIRTRGPLDREYKPKHQLVLSARDNGSPVAFESLRFLTVVLQDVDDNRPEFSRTQTTDPYVFTLEENLPPGFPVGRVVAHDADEGDNARVFYYIIDGNFGAPFRIEKTTGVLRSNRSFDREESDAFELVVRATGDPDHAVYEREEHPGFGAASRSYRREDLSLALVRVLVADVNDNAPRFLGAPYLAGVRASAQVGDAMLSVSASDADLGAHGRFEYRLDAVRLFRPGMAGVRPVPSPFEVSPEGQVTAVQLMAQYDHGRFELQVAARETAPPHRVARAAVKLWIYEPRQLVRVTVPEPPEYIHSKKGRVHEILSNATGGTVVIDDVRYHVNEKRTLNRKWTDLYIHVVNDRDEMMLIPQVLEAVDSNSELLDELNIHKIVPAASMDVAEEEEFDLALAALVSLLVVLLVGIVTMVVCCLCLKKWYAVKIREALIPRDEVDNGNTTENPLWTEQKLKLYEEQELSMSVVPDPGGGEGRRVTADVEAVYATLRKGMATFGADYATLDGCSTGPPQGHEYHELNAAKDPDPSSLSIDKDGEPVLVTELL